MLSFGNIPKSNGFFLCLRKRTETPAQSCAGVAVSLWREGKLQKNLASFVVYAIVKREDGAGEVPVLSPISFSLQECLSCCERVGRFGSINNHSLGR